MRPRLIETTGLESVVYCGKSDSVEVDRKDIFEIWARMNDDFTIDTLVLELWSDGGYLFSLSEDDEGFSDLLAWLESNRLITNPKWKAEILAVPFNPNRVLVYSREAGA